MNSLRASINLWNIHHNEGEILNHTETKMSQFTDSTTFHKNATWIMPSIFLYCFIETHPKSSTIINAFCNFIRNDLRYFFYQECANNTIASTPLFGILTINMSSWHDHLSKSDLRLRKEYAISSYGPRVPCVCLPLPAILSFRRLFSLLPFPVENIFLSPEI